MRNPRRVSTPARQATAPAKLTPFISHRFTNGNVTASTETSATMLPMKLALKLRNVINKSPKNQRKAVSIVDRMMGCRR